MSELPTYGATRCSCCDLPAESCGRELERRQRAELAERRHRLLELPGVTPARYSSTCGSCGDWTVKAGDPIAFHAGGWVGLLCCGDRLPVHGALT